MPDFFYKLGDVQSWTDKWVDFVDKEKILATCDPRDTSTYIFDDEESYYNDYAKSLFAITMKKGGWDCLRHYEILAAGCLPVFLNISQNLP